MLLDGRARAAPDPIIVPERTRGPGGPAGLRLEQRMAFHMRQPLTLRVFFLARHFIDSPQRLCQIGTYQRHSSAPRIGAHSEGRVLLREAVDSMNSRDKMW